MPKFLLWLTCLVAVALSFRFDLCSLLSCMDQSRRHVVVFPAFSWKQFWFSILKYAEKTSFALLVSISWFVVFFSLTGITSKLIGWQQWKQKQIITSKFSIGNVSNEITSHCDRNPQRMHQTLSHIRNARPMSIKQFQVEEPVQKKVRFRVAGQAFASSVEVPLLNPPLDGHHGHHHACSLLRQSGAHLKS